MSNLLTGAIIFCATLLGFKGFIFVLSVYGFTNIVTTSYLFSRPRNAIKSVFPHAGELFNCSMCFGFWAGVIISLMGWGISGTPEFFYGVNVFGDWASEILMLLRCLIDGWIASGLAWLMINEPEKD